MRNWTWLQWSILIGSISLVVLSGLAIYLLLQPSAAPPDISEPVPELPIGELPQPEIGRPPIPPSPVEQVPVSQLQGAITERSPDLVALGSTTSVQTITPFPSDFVNLAANGTDVNYYDPDTNRFFQIDQNGFIVDAGSQVFAEVENATWAPSGSSAVIEFPDGSNIVYDFATNDQITLPAHWENFDFSPDSSKLAFKSMAVDIDQRWLAVSDLRGGSTRRIRALGRNGGMVNVNWAPNNQVVATYDETRGLNRSELFFVGFNDENFPLSKLNGLKFEGNWTPSGDQMIYSIINETTNFNPQLWVVDGMGPTMGQNRKPINLQTWTDKCSFVTDTEMICGVPQSLPQGAGLIRSVADDIADDLYMVNIQNGSTRLLASPQEDLQVKKLVISEDGDRIFIQDNFTNQIKSIELP